MLGIIVDRAFHEEKRWVVFQTYHLIEALRTAYDGVLISSQEEYDRQKDSLSAVYANCPGWGAPKIRYDGSLNHPKGIILSDAHKEENKRNYFGYVDESGFDYIFAYYYYPSVYHFPRYKHLIVHTPWAIPDQYVCQAPTFHGQDFIQIHGAVKGDAYDTRRWCHQFPYVAVSDNSGVEQPQFTDGEYDRWLGNRDAVIAAGSLANKYQLVTPKYFEIMNSGALLFAQHCRDLPLLGFDDSNCVVFDETTFQDEAARYLANPVSYLERRICGQQLIRERHLISHRVRSIGEALALNRTASAISNFGGIPGTHATMLLDDSRYLDKDILHTGIFEPDLSQFFRDYIRPGMRCVDVGANLGYYSMLFAFLGAEVLAFEPALVYRKTLEQNIAANNLKHVQVFEHALSEKNGTRLLYVGECSATMHWVADSKPRTTELMELSTLDDIVKNRIDVLKVDVDGHDMPVLRGAIEIIKRDAPLIAFEISSPNYHHAQESLPGCYQFFEQLGYGLYREDAPGQRIASVTEFVQKSDVKERSWNFLARKIGTE